MCGSTSLTKPRVRHMMWSVYSVPNTQTPVVSGEHEAGITRLCRAGSGIARLDPSDNSIVIADTMLPFLDRQRVTHESDSETAMSCFHERQSCAKRATRPRPLYESMCAA